MDIVAVLTNKFSNDSWSINADDYKQLVWLSDTPKPTLKKLEELWPSVKKEIQDKATAKTDARTSALNKLSALGLTQEEIDSL